jgi:hypothetical protein
VSGKSKLFWGAFAAELLVAGIIGWKIARAQHHPWEVTPPPKRKPNPLPPSPLPRYDPRGQRQRQGVAHQTQANHLAGEITTKDETP